MLTFTSGLLTNADHYAALNRFWDLIHNKHRDLIGFRHLQLLIPCIDEGHCSDSIETKNQIIQYITNWVQYILSSKCHALQNTLDRPSQYLYVASSTIRNSKHFMSTTSRQTFKLIQRAVLLLISKMPSSDSSSEIFSLVSRHLHAENPHVRCAAVWALAKLGEKAPRSDIISRFVVSLEDSDKFVRESARKALARLGEKAATNEVISRLVISLGDT